MTVDLKKEGKLTNFNESKHNCKQHFFLVYCEYIGQRYMNTQLDSNYHKRKKKRLKKTKTIITSMFLMMTHFPFVYRKLLPLGSPPITFEVPLVICGSPANMLSERRSGGISN